jgi:hypothetical protein
VKEGVSKSNHPIQNPLLLVTDILCSFVCFVLFECRVLFCVMLFVCCVIL